MKRILFFIVLCFSPYLSIGTPCGKELWAKKTLSDSMGDALADKKPVRARISTLINIPNGHTKKELLDAAATRFPAETRVYAVDALVVGYMEEDDSDFHIVLADPSNPKATMVAEMPSGDCAPEKQRIHFHELRDKFTAAFSQPPKGKLHELTTPVPVLVVGVGFFDLKHPVPQHGVAPNDFELHPVLAFTKK